MSTFNSNSMSYAKQQVNRKYKSNRSPPPLPPTTAPPYTVAAGTAGATSVGGGEELYSKKSKLNAINTNTSNNNNSSPSVTKSSSPPQQQLSNYSSNSSNNRHNNYYNNNNYQQHRYQSSTNSYKNKHYHATNNRSSYHNSRTSKHDHHYYYHHHHHHNSPHHYNCKYRQYGKKKQQQQPDDDNKRQVANAFPPFANALAAADSVTTFGGALNDDNDCCLERASPSPPQLMQIQLVQTSSSPLPPLATATATTTTRDYSALPNVVLTKIFSFLNFHDRLQASQACKRWRAGLFDPCLWQRQYDLVVYLCNRQQDLESAYFKLSTFGKYAQSCSIKFNPNDAYLFHEVANLLELLQDKSNENSSAITTAAPGSFTAITQTQGTAAAVGLGSKTSPNNLKRLSLEPIYSYYFESGSLHHHPAASSPSKHYNIERSNRRIFKALRELISNSKCFEHLALGCMTDLGRSYDNLVELLSETQQTQSDNLKSLHISSIRHASSLSLSTFLAGRSCVGSVGNHGNRMDDMDMSLSSGRLANSFLKSFSNLGSLSIDLEELSDEIVVQVCGGLKKLSINVNSIDYDLRTADNNAVAAAAATHVKDESWSIARERNAELRVKVNFLTIQGAEFKYKYVLNTTMPLDTLRMYFCKSLNPGLLQYLSDNYSDTLQSLCIVDSMTESPSLRYHNPLRYDTDPDPLVLLCWKCRHLSKLVLVGYEILKINLIAIAKLRSNLSLFYVPMDCIIDLTYGKFTVDDDFIEDEDGEDTIVDYRACSNHVIHKVCSILKCPNWHPLERDELPMCVYDPNISMEEAFLDTLIHDQQNQNSSHF